MFKDPDFTLCLGSVSHAHSLLSKNKNRTEAAFKQPPLPTCHMYLAGLIYRLILNLSSRKGHFPTPINPLVIIIFIYIKCLQYCLLPRKEAILLFLFQSPLIPNGLGLATYANLKSHGFRGIRRLLLAFGGVFLNLKPCIFFGFYSFFP
jgi:hypothetical protein